MNVKSSTDPKQCQRSRALLLRGIACGSIRDRARAEEAFLAFLRLGFFEAGGDVDLQNETALLAFEAARTEYEQEQMMKARTERRRAGETAFRNWQRTHPKEAEEYEIRRQLIAKLRLDQDKIRQQCATSQSTCADVVPMLQHYETQIVELERANDRMLLDFR